uniref:glycerophosphocholine cholinephosphodiesterase n=1 Tax=Anisakis simplex TaxID=6269 RepID=A0A0M3K1L0_ANISI
LLLICLIHSTLVTSQKLLVIIAEGLAGSQYHKFSHLPGFRTFQTSGVWSTLLYPEFPTLPIPNRQTLMTGLLPHVHGLVGEQIYNQDTGNIFSAFHSPSDYIRDIWWKYEPVYVTAQKAGIPSALFFFPECKVRWRPSPSICEAPDESGLDSIVNVKRIIEATRTHDLVMVNHVKIREHIERFGPQNIRYSKSEEIEKFTQVLERLQSQVRDRIDLNMLVVSPHGYIDVPQQNVRYLDHFVPMELVNLTVGFGALKQIIPFPGRTHQIYTQLRYSSPIPNVKVYYTAKNIGDIPSWYFYHRCDVIPDLVLIATPGYAIYTASEQKQLPRPSETVHRKGLSGYNNEYPDMLGILLAFGPIFRSGMRKGPTNLVDLYELICAVLQIKCTPSFGNFTNVDDIFVEDALTRIKSVSSNRSGANFVDSSLYLHYCIALFLLLRIFFVL